MKILELRFKNLNSLYGEWHIDFTDPEYAYNGIFALTGPTGAGKSTILDAICLALYGSTPRLGRITQSSNDIMSRQTGECYAEVAFESQAGRYRCHWAHHRSRKRADGELQSPRHEIAEATGEKKIIENKLTAVLATVEEKTGMDFDRFTRSILLAQGGFDTFLKATVEQKSKILEQITGTKIYSEISVGVHERLRQEKTTLSNLEAETRGILILTQEEEEATEKKLKETEQQEDALSTVVSDLAKASTWLQGIEGLQKEIQTLAEDERVLTQEMLLFTPERSALELASKAATLEGVYATLIEIRNQQNTDSSLLAAEETAFPTLVSDAKAGSLLLLAAEEQTEQAKAAQKQAIPLLKQVRLLDQKLLQAEATITTSTSSIEADKVSIDSFKKDKESQTMKVASEKEKLLLVETYLKGHAQDAYLVTDLTGITEQIQAISSKQKEVNEKEEDEEKTANTLKRAEDALVACKTKREILQEEHARANQTLEAKKEELSKLLERRLLREYRAEKDVLLREREYLARIAALEEHRNNLIDGKACPLCGSLEHPFAVGNVPSSNKTDEKIRGLSQLINDAEDLELTILELVKKEQDAGTALNEQKVLESHAQHAKDSAQIAHTATLNGLENAQKQLNLMKGSSMEKLNAYGIEKLSDDLSSLLTSLRNRKDRWLAHENEKKTIENTINLLHGELQRLDGVLTTQGQVLETKQTALRSLTEALLQSKEERTNLYGDKDADREEEKLAEVVSFAETAEKRANSHNTDLLQKVNIAKTRIASLQASLTKRKPILETKESLFLEELSSTGFSDEKHFLSVILPVAKRTHLSLEAKNLDDRNTELKAKQNDRVTRLGVEQAKKMTDKSLADIQFLFEEKGSELQEVRDAVAENKARLKGNLEAKQRIEDKQERIEDQRKECSKWDKLHSLIGSADGKKFRNFAQGLTFELMVSHANRQLTKMSDRYLLIRSDEQPLELNVIDNYQAGEIRSTKNLSGGESFIISLTLALGLSKMASRKVRVDSLFLDEGFGSLDEESLETALKTLSGLQQDGKLIGVISHVSAMQEMISTQITIIPTSGGRSILTGPGCSRVG